MTESINPAYLDQETLEELQQYYASSEGIKSVTLSNFFSKEGMEAILQEILTAEFDKDYHEMTHRRYKSVTTTTIDTLLGTDIFKDLIHKITGLKIVDLDTTMFRFGHREYQIISDETILPEGLDLIFDLTPQWVEQLGGIVTYTDGEGQFYNLPPNFGSLTLVERPPNFHYFVKYVNHYAEKLQRVIVISNTRVER